MELSFLEIRYTKHFFRRTVFFVELSGLIVEGSLASVQDGNISFEALQDFGKTINFARSTIQKFVRP